MNKRTNKVFVGCLLIVALTLTVGCAKVNTPEMPTPTPDSSVVTPANGENGESGSFENEEDVFETPEVAGDTTPTATTAVTATATDTAKDNTQVPNVTAKPSETSKIDVTPEPTAVPTPVATVTPTDNGEIELPRIPWD